MKKCWESTGPRWSSSVLFLTPLAIETLSLTFFISVTKFFINRCLLFLQAHPALNLADRNKRAEDYAKGGRNLSSWDMWVALETYLQVRENHSVLRPVVEVCLGHTGVTFQAEKKMQTRQTMQINGVSVRHYC